jgi:Cupin domain
MADRSRSAEIFFVLHGALQALAGDRVLTLETGDFLVVPRNMPHAFAAPSGTRADVLIVFAPGASDRFGYFRLGERVLRGQASPQEILDSQDRFDNHFMASPVWQAARAGSGAAVLRRVVPAAGHEPNAEFSRTSPSIASTGAAPRSASRSRTHDWASSLARIAPAWLVKTPMLATSSWPEWTRV